MADEDMPTIIDPSRKSPDTITVRVSQVLAYQETMEKRVRNQTASINRLLAQVKELQVINARLLAQVKELQGINARDADEIAKLTRALTEEQQLYADQKVLLDRTREERDELIATFGDMMGFLRNRGLEHTKEGETVYARPGEAFTADVEWQRHADTAVVDPDNEPRAALPQVLPVGESRPGRHLAGD